MRRALLFGACALLFAACGRGGESSGAGSPAALAAQSFLERVPQAPMRIAYGGARHVRLSYSIAGAPSLLEYDETVTSDGQGHFSILPGAVTSPSMTPDQSELFSILQERRDGFFYRYRDFRIRDWRSFLRNWSAVDTGREETVAGRNSSVLEFRRNTGGGSWYRAWIDPETGLVMRADEFDGAGTELGRVEFTTFTLAPDLPSASLHGDRSEATPIDPDADTTSTLGFRVLQPRILPAGYRLERAERVSDGSDAWALLAYGDGVEQLFFLQTDAPIRRTEATVAAVGPKSVQILHVGPWTVLQGQFERTRVVVMGKADEPSLRRMLKSAIH